MYLSRIIYASRKLHGLAADELGNILRSAEKNNRSLGITGMLCFNRKFFLQVLEGRRTSINQAYNRIVTDPRHEDVILVDYCRIERREFDNWAMGYVPEAGLTSELLLRYGGSADFNPLEMSPASVMGMMCELRDSLRTVSTTIASGKTRVANSAQASA